MRAFWSVYEEGRRIQSDPLTDEYNVLWRHQFSISKISEQCLMDLIFIKLLGVLHKQCWQDVGLFYHLPPCVDIFYDMNVDKKWTFLDHLPNLSCKRSLWMTLNEKKVKKNSHGNCHVLFWTQQRYKPCRPWFWRWIFQHSPSTRPSWCASCRRFPWWRSSSPARTSSWQFICYHTGLLKWK